MRIESNINGRHGPRESFFFKAYRFELVVLVHKNLFDTSTINFVTNRQEVVAGECVCSGLPI